MSQNDPYDLAKIYMNRIASTAGTSMLKLYSAVKYDKHGIICG